MPNERDITTALNDLTAAQFDTVLGLLSIPADTVRGPATPLASRARDLVDAMRQRGGSSLAVLGECIDFAKGSPRPRPLFTIGFARHKLPLRQKFYKDLVAELRRQAPHLVAADQEVGYLDPEETEPNAWSPWTLRALETCQVFVPLLEGAFFNSAYCGKEWNVFRARQDRVVNTLGGHLPQRVLPVLWRPHADSFVPPLAVREITFQHLAFGQEYADHGLYHLIQGAFTRADGTPERSDYYRPYQTFLEKLAACLLEIAAVDLPTATDAPPPLAEAPSALPNLAAAPPLNDATGLEYVQFAFVAAEDAEMKAYRIADSVACYGQACAAWKPYYPQLEFDIEKITQNETSKQPELKWQSLPITPAKSAAEFQRDLDQAWSKRRIVIIIVDPWSVQLDHYERLLGAYNTLNYINCAMLISWNNDAETQQFERELRRRLRQTLPAKALIARQAGAPADDEFLRHEADFRGRIRTPGELRDELHDVLDWVRQEIRYRTSPPRALPGGAEPPRAVGAPVAAPRRIDASAVVRKAVGPSDFDRPRLRGSQ